MGVFVFSTSSIFDLQVEGEPDEAAFSLSGSWRRDNTKEREREGEKDMHTVKRSMLLMDSWSCISSILYPYRYYSCRPATAVNKVAELLMSELF